MTHDDMCERSGNRYRAKECREFSTDGTAMGALIAHSMGTTDEGEIKRQGLAELDNNRHLTGMEKEQADWDADE